MFQNLFVLKYRVLLFFFLVVFLILLRNYESILFYDPFTIYFKNEFVGKKYPKYETIRLIISWIMRYIANSIFSLGILYALFQEIAIVKFSIALYTIFLVLLVLTIFLILKFFDESYAMILFNVRRFLIQPLFLILFIPAFYYQKKTL